jgi:predicted nucleotidyltransferase
MNGASVLTAEDPALKQMTDRLAEAYRPERIYLFGSVARGDAGPDSDYDLLVVVPDDSAPELLKSRAGYRASRDLAVPRDVLVVKSSEFARQLRLRASLASTVVREGRMLYER